jgi:hypothetical protein
LGTPPWFTAVSPWHIQQRTWNSVRPSSTCRGSPALAGNGGSTFGSTGGSA